MRGDIEDYVEDVADQADEQQPDAAQYTKRSAAGSEDGVGHSDWCLLLLGVIPC